MLRQNLKGKEKNKRKKYKLIQLKYLKFVIVNICPCNLVNKKIGCLNLFTLCLSFPIPYGGQEDGQDKV